MASTWVRHLNGFGGMIGAIAIGSLANRQPSELGNPLGLQSGCRRRSIWDDVIVEPLKKALLQELQVIFGQIAEKTRQLVAAKNQVA